tara:strand:- start:2598 stop:3158 length:561 start_codon:yes stop_codon:yes gene_type:complete
MPSTQNLPVAATMTIDANTIHDAGYPTAAWYRTFKHEAQTVEVRLSGNFACYRITGRTTHEHFPSLFGGVATGGGTVGDCDKPSTHSVQTYGYMAAKMVEDGRMELADGYEISESFCDHPEYCLGYETVYAADGSSTFGRCGCPHHVDGSGELQTGERSSRGFLARGYAPGVKTTKRHIKIVKSSI